VSAQTHTEIAESLGHVTAACYSPMLGTHVGLALVKDGRAKIGSRAKLSDPLRGVMMPIEIIAANMFDESGSRMHG
jgi:methylglutamate dehydrogenase subunit C